MQRRIGILRTGSIGDHLITVPLYRRIKETHPDDTLVLICNVPAQGNRKLVGPASFLPETMFDEWISYPVGSDWSAIKQTYWMFRSAKLDLLYYLMPGRSAPKLWRDRMFFLVARVPVVGLHTSADSRHPHSVAGSTRVEHELARLSRSVCMVPGTTPLDRSIDVTESERGEARIALGGRPGCAIVISIGTKIVVNDWGVENWSELIRRLGEVRTIDRLILIGSADEHSYSEVLRQHWPREASNLCGRLSPRISAAVLAESQLFVGHDSGPMHMAAAVDVPIVAIFSSRNLPGLWFPLGAKSRVHYSSIACMGCGKLTCEDLHKECIRRISVQEVFESCVAALSR